MEEKTLMYDQIYKFDGGEGNSTHNNVRDAFKHTFLSAVLAMRYSDYESHLLGTGHEVKNLITKTPPKESIMDLYNNRIGRKIASEVERELATRGASYSEKEIEDIIAQKVIDNIQQGIIITKLEDPRITSLSTKLLLAAEELKLAKILDGKYRNKLATKIIMRNTDNIIDKIIEKIKSKKSSNNATLEGGIIYNDYGDKKELPQQSPSQFLQNPVIMQDNGYQTIIPKYNKTYENLSYKDRVYYQGDEPTAIWDKDDEDVTKQDELEFKVFNRQVMNDNWKLPTKEELDERVARGELIWVDGYTKQDGTVVKGYFRHYPETA